MDLASAGDSSVAASATNSNNTVSLGFPTHLVSAAVNVLDGGGVGPGNGILYEPSGNLAGIGGEILCLGHIDSYAIV